MRTWRAASSSIRLRCKLPSRYCGQAARCLIKSFINNDLQAFTAELKQYFSEVQRTKPEATRQGSSEFYFYAKGFLACANSNRIKFRRLCSVIIYV